MTDETKRMNPTQRRALIIEAAHDIASECDGGLLALDYDTVSEWCAVPTSVGTIRRYFHTIGDLQRAVTVRNRDFHDQAVRIGLL